MKDTEENIVSVLKILLQNIYIYIYIPITVIIFLFNLSVRRKKCFTDEVSKYP